MPSSEDCISAQSEVFEWAVSQFVKEGHPERSAREIVRNMSYDKRVRKAEQFRGPIYRGAYSPY